MQISANGAGAIKVINKAFIIKNKQSNRFRDKSITKTDHLYYCNFNTLKTLMSSKNIYIFLIPL